MLLIPWTNLKYNYNYSEQDCHQLYIIKPYKTNLTIIFFFCVIYYPIWYNRVINKSNNLETFVEIGSYPFMLIIIVTILYKMKEIV